MSDVVLEDLSIRDASSVVREVGDMMKIVKLAAVAGLVLGSASGCMSFNGNEIRRPEVEQPQEAFAVVELKVAKFDKLMNGRSESLGSNLNEGFLGRAEVAQIARMWKIEHLIKEFGFPGDLDDETATHRLVISGSADEEGSLVAAFVTGLTLYLFPSSATLTTELDVTLLRLSDRREFTAKVKNSYTVWQQIVFLPTSLFGSLIWGSYGSQKDRSLYLYDEFKRAGAFERTDGSKEPTNPEATFFRPVGSGSR